MQSNTGTKKSGAKETQPLLTILIPVYNEEKTLKHILEKVTALPIKNYEVLIVDDASHDDSKNIIEKFHKNFSHSNIKVKALTHDKNRGKGAGIKTGLEYAQGQYFIIQDADLEYDPADIPALLEAALTADHPVVYGSRFKGEMHNMPAPNFYANRFYNFLLRRLYPTAITDMHTCYKMVRTDLMRELQMSSEGFGYATELVSKLLKRGVPIHEAPISFHGRTKKEGKKIGVSDGIDCTYMILKYRFGKIA